ncbi:divergent protein kinase domain 1C isoform X1 [Musca autumnalis]|uniref:divergent protein kinase domain 1C isoform X1 n=1 Tax=Musca autumnalis TaxID=221902 RepID=UPI003CFB63AE
MLNAFKRKFRTILQRCILLAILAAIFMLIVSYMNLEFCYKIMSQNSLTYMCKKYKNYEYSGTLCEELCANEQSFKSFKCPQTDMGTIMFTAEKNGDVYAVKLARHIKDDLSWINSRGMQVYPKIENFHHIVKMHITLTYNVTLDDNMIKALVNQEIDKNNPQQMLNFWRLFKDNNYMMSKLYDEDSLFPTVLGSCGPYYATESLNILKTEQSLLQYISSDWQKRLKYALSLMEFVFKMDEMKPEPLRMCKMKISNFGVTGDKRIKYENAEHVYVETKIDKRLSDGSPCEEDADCNFHYCMGKCDPKTSTCTGTQQNNNLQIFCDKILKGGGLFPGLLASAKTPKNLMKMVKNCIDPSKFNNLHVPGRLYAPNTELALRLYNEMKRLHKVDSKETVVGTN